MRLVFEVTGKDVELGSLCKIVLYTVIGSWEWEGANFPVGIFSTKESAEEAKAQAAAASSDSCDYYEIVEYTLNEARHD